MIQRLLLLIAFIFLSTVSFYGCSDSKQDSQSSNNADTAAVTEMQLSLNSNVDVLTPVEFNYFKKFKNVEDFFVSDTVVRYNRVENGKMVNFYNEFIYKRDVADLIAGIYMFYSCTYTPIVSSESDPFINYSFRAGNASAGNGSIIKLGDKIILTQRGCGTSCSTIVRANGKKVYEKTK